MIMQYTVYDPDPTHDAGSLASPPWNSCRRCAKCSPRIGLCGVLGMGEGIPHRETWHESRIFRMELVALYMCVCVCACNAIARHSQPEFKAKSLRDSYTGYAEMACKAHNVTYLHWFIRMYNQVCLALLVMLCFRSGLM